MFLSISSTDLKPNFLACASVIFFRDLLNAIGSTCVCFSPTGILKFASAEPRPFITSTIASSVINPPSVSTVASSLNLNLVRLPSLSSVMMLLYLLLTCRISSLISSFCSKPLVLSSFVFNGPTIESLVPSALLISFCTSSDILASCFLGAFFFVVFLGAFFTGASSVTGVVSSTTGVTFFFLVFLLGASLIGAFSTTGGASFNISNPVLVFFASLFLTKLSQSFSPGLTPPSSTNIVLDTTFLSPTISLTAWYAFVAIPLF